MQVPTGRSEKRILKAVGVTARLSDGSSLPEGTFTENISMRGARIVTKTKLRPGGMLEVHFRTAEIQSQSRVVYCQQLPDGRFAIGLEMTQNSSERGEGGAENQFETGRGIHNLLPRVHGRVGFRGFRSFPKRVLTFG